MNRVIFSLLSWGGGQVPQKIMIIHDFLDTYIHTYNLQLSDLLYQTNHQKSPKYGEKYGEMDSLKNPYMVRVGWVPQKNNDLNRFFK